LEASVAGSHGITEKISLARGLLFVLSGVLIYEDQQMERLRKILKISEFR